MTGIDVEILSQDGGAAGIGTRENGYNLVTKQGE